MYLEKRLPMGDDVVKDDIENVESLNEKSDIMFQSLDIASSQVEEVIIKLTDVA